MRGTAQTGSRYSFYLDATAFDGRWPFPAVWPRGRPHLHVGSISAVDPRHGESVVAALRRRARRATTSFDPNIRPLVTPDRDSVVALVERQVALASIVKASEEDLEWLYPGRAIEETLEPVGAARAALLRRDARRSRRRRLSRRRAAERRGAESRRRRHRRRRRQFHVRAAGGDGPRRRARRRRAPTPSRERLAAWLAFAAAASAITCTRKGSDPPTRREMASAEYSHLNGRHWTKGVRRGVVAAGPAGRLKGAGRSCNRTCNDGLERSTSPPPAARPLSPHLGIYRFTLTMAMSIAHRITGAGLYVGVLLLAWFLLAASMDASAFAYFSAFIQSIIGRLVLFGFTWALFHHLLGGVRHLIWDAGYGMDHPEREQLAQATLIGGVALTLVVWAIGYAVR